MVKKSLVLGFFSTLWAMSCAEASSLQDDINSLLITKTTIINFSTPQTIIPASYFIESYKDDLQTIIMEEKTGAPASSSDWQTIPTLSSEEAKLYLADTVSEFLKDDGLTDEEKDLFISKVFSERHFPNLRESRNDVDILSLDEKSLFDFLSRLPYLDDAIFGSRDGYDKMQEEQNRIDPRVFLLKPDVVRKWYYTHKCIADRMTSEEYKTADYSQLKPELFSQYFTFPEIPKERPAYYRTHKISFLSQELIQDIYTTAQRILKQTTAKDRIIIFGNTPYFVGRALERIMSHYPEQASTFPKIIYLPFSGAPNIQTARNPFAPYYDLVTPYRFAHFKNRLRSLGLLSDTPSLLEGTTYILDVIAAGSGPSYTIETILRDFQENLPGPIPNFEIISLNTFRPDEVRHQKITSHFVEDGERLVLSFPSIKETKFTVPAQVLFLPNHGILDFMPDSCPITRIVPKYNARYWTKEHDHVLTTPLSSMGKILLEHFDENIKALMEQEPSQKQVA